MKKEEFVLAGKHCQWIIKIKEEQTGSGNFPENLPGNFPENFPEVVILYAAGSHEENAENIAEKVKSTRSFGLLLFEAEDWDLEYSPWPFLMEEGEGKSRTFGGGGPKTLEWLTEAALPWIRKQYRELPTLVIAGYSLAGLFALWSFYEAGQSFAGVIAASASLWYEGWAKYMEESKAPEQSLAYLSLGGKEPKSRHPYMCRVGEAYEAQKKRMILDPGVKQVIFQWNPGGHFADSQIRIAKGVDWMLERI